jgi:hypothetical protein
LYGCETWFFALRTEQNSAAFEERLLGEKFESKRGKERGG